MESGRRLYVGLAYRCIFDSYNYTVQAISHKWVLLSVIFIMWVDGIALPTIYYNYRITRSTRIYRVFVTDVTDMTYVTYVTYVTDVTDVTYVTDVADAPIRYISH